MHPLSWTLHHFFLFSVYARKCQMICQTYWHNNHAAKEKTPSITLNMLFISVALRSLSVRRSAFLSQPAVSHLSVSWELMSKALFSFFTCCAFDAGVHKLLGAAEHEDRQRRFISVSSGLPLFSLFLWIFPFFLSLPLSLTWSVLSRPATSQWTCPLRIGSLAPRRASVQHQWELFLLLFF